jgi:hypothetical protein
VSCGWGWTPHCFAWPVPAPILGPQTDLTRLQKDMDTGQKVSVLDWLGFLGQGQASYPSPFTFSSMSTVLERASSQEP